MTFTNTFATWPTGMRINKVIPADEVTLIILNTKFTPVLMFDGAKKLA